MDDIDHTLTFAAGASAFGDGSHPTTRGMLAALESIDPELFQPGSACDMGTGSGIVALAILRHFDCPVLAVDISAQAVETLQQNAALNHVENRLVGIRANGFHHPDIDRNAPFDLIAMNILAEPLIRLAAEANRHLAAEGVLILSGILLWQETPIRDAYTALGLELTSRLMVGDWVTLVWQKPES